MINFFRESHAPTRRVLKGFTRPSKEILHFAQITIKFEIEKSRKYLVLIAIMITLILFTHYITRINKSLGVLSIGSQLQVDYHCYNTVGIKV